MLCAAQLLPVVWAGQSSNSIFEECVHPAPLFHQHNDVDDTAAGFQAQTAETNIKNERCL